MFIDFVNILRELHIPVSIRELLLLHEAMQKRLAFIDIEEFYYLGRLCLVKDEQHFDRYDQAFGYYFQQIVESQDWQESLIPESWLEAEFLKNLSAAEKEKIKSLGGFDQLLKELKKRLKEQHGKHQGGNKWIGTGGTSPFGNSGYHPEGIRIGGRSQHRSAVKVWEKRQFENLDGSIQLGTRQLKMALRKLRKYARTGAKKELDLTDTIHSTANNGGLLDIKMIPERHNQVKLLVFFDVGGSMDRHVRKCEELFSAIRSEFKHLYYYYFHNCIYEAVWADNNRRHDERISTYDLINRYGGDYHVIIVGDAEMSPYEISEIHGSVEYMNDESGHTWLKRMTDQWEKLIWLNPNPESHWSYIQSTQMIQHIVNRQMYPLSLSGLDAAISFLSR